MPQRGTKATIRAECNERDSTRELSETLRCEEEQRKLELKRKLDEQAEPDHHARSEQPSCPWRTRHKLAATMKAQCATVVRGYR